MDEQLPKGALTPLADPEQQRLATRRVLPGHPAQPRRKLPPVLERRRLPDGGDQGGRGQGADPELIFPQEVTPLPSPALRLAFRFPLTHSQPYDGRQSLMEETMNWKTLL